MQIESVISHRLDCLLGRDFSRVQPRLCERLCFILLALDDVLNFSLRHDIIERVSDVVQ